MATHKNSRKSSPKTARRASSSNSSFGSAAEATEVLRKRFEKRIGEVRNRFQSFEKDWSKTVDTLVTRGRSAEKDLRKRLDKVTRDLNRNDLLARVKKTQAFRVVTNGELIERVQDRVEKLDVEKVVSRLRKDVKGVQSDVVDFFQSSASRLKNVIDLPSRTDFERLSKKIENLSAQVKTLEKRKRA